MRTEKTIGVQKNPVHLDVEISDCLSLIVELHRNYSAIVEKLDSYVRARQFGHADLLISTLGRGLASSYDVQLNRARLELTRGNAKAVLDVCASLRHWSPDDAELIGLILCALCMQTRFDEAFNLIQELPPASLSADWAMERLFSEFKVFKNAGSLDPRGAMKRIAICHQEPKMFLARYKRLAGLQDEAEKEIFSLAKLKPKRLAIQLELGLVMLESAQWHKYCELYASLANNPNVPEVSRDKFVRALDIFSILESSNRQLKSANPDYTLPDRLLEIVVLGVNNALYPSFKNRIAMIGATLAAGGAERALGNAFLGLHLKPKFDAELWLYSIHPGHGHDFFIRELGFSTGIRKNSVFNLTFESSSFPFSYLPTEIGINSEAVYRQILERHPSVVHAWQDQTNIEVAIAAIKAGVPKIILHPHNMRPDLIHKSPISKSYRRVYRALLSRNDVHMVFVSRASMLDYLKWLEADQNERCHVIYNGFNWKVPKTVRQRKKLSAETRKQFGISHKALVVGGIFRFHWIKRPKLWLEVAKEFLRYRPDTKFLLFGDGPMLDECKTYAKSLKISDSVVFAGEVKCADQKVVAFDLLLHTSESEGLPSVLIEAQAAAIPVVAFDTGGVIECLEPKNSESVKVDSIKAYAGAIGKILDRSIPQRTKEICASNVRKKFSISAMTQKLAEIYGT